MNVIAVILVVVAVIACVSVHGWTMDSSPAIGKQNVKKLSSSDNTRRTFITTAITTTTISSITGMLPPDAALAKSLGSKESVVQREINTFNSLIYNFKNTALDGGLDASTLKEPSISFIEFGEAMKKGQVSFVEFMAPNGLVAYATLKKNPKKPIRIGQGYPTGAKNSWSSPDFVIRSVSNFGVPYKFTVPALEKYKRKV
jgi:hypothetical protein